jgi:quinol monooxygenase YgiN
MLITSCNPRSAAPEEGDTKSVQGIETQKMITAKVFIKAGQEAKFAEAAKWIIDLTLKEEGCLEYTLYQDPYNPTNFFFFERYKDQAAVDAHFAASYFTEFGTKIGDITSQPAEIKIWDISENK